MHAFTLSRPTGILAAIAAHAQNAQLAFIAGGTDLIGLMKDRVTLPDHLLDINRLPDMAQIEALSDGALRIGALARMSDVAANPDVRSRSVSSIFCPATRRSMTTCSNGAISSSR